MSVLASVLVDQLPGSLEEPVQIVQALVGEPSAFESSHSSSGSNSEALQHLRGSLVWTPLCQVQWIRILHLLWIQAVPNL